MFERSRSIRFDQKSAYIGNIQVSKATALRLAKKEAEDIQKKKLENKHSYKRGSNLNQENHPVNGIPPHQLIVLGSSTKTSKKKSIMRDVSPIRFSLKQPSNILTQSKKISKMRSDCSQTITKTKVPFTNIINLVSETPDKVVVELEDPLEKKEEVPQMKRSILKRSTIGLETKKFLEDDFMNKNPLYISTPAVLPIQKKEEPKTHNYESLFFKKGKGSKKLIKFICFKEKELNIPEQFSKKIIRHRVDEDCATDDEQISLAIKRLQYSIFLAKDN